MPASSMRASLRSTSSFSGIDDSYRSYPKGVRGKDDEDPKTHVNTFHENNNRGK